jgi:hypothetical protein
MGVQRDPSVSVGINLGSGRLRVICAPALQRSIIVSLLNLLSFDEKQLDMVTDAVFIWCREHRQSFNGKKGRAAMQAALAIAYSKKCSPAELRAVLDRHLERGET